MKTNSPRIPKGRNREGRCVQQLRGRTVDEGEGQRGGKERAGREMEEGKSPSSQVVTGRLRSDAAAGRAETLEDRIVPTETKGSGSWPDDYSPFSEGERRERGDEGHSTGEWKETTKGEGRGKEDKSKRKRGQRALNEKTDGVGDNQWMWKRVETEYC